MTVCENMTLDNESNRNNATCEKVSDLLVDYINQRLTRSEINGVIKHIAVCRNCRIELALLIRIRDFARENYAPVPKDIIDTAFDKIHDEENTLNAILSSNSYSMPLDLLCYLMSTVKQSMSIIRDVMLLAKHAT